MKKLEHHLLLILCVSLACVFISNVSCNAESTKEDDAGYIYKGDQFRDPFIPLTEQGGGISYAPVTADIVAAGAFSTDGLELTGIVQTPTNRLAMIRTKDGQTLFVKNGKIYDPRKRKDEERIVKGFVGIVKEKTLVIIGPNNQVSELKIKKSDKNSLKSDIKRFLN